MCCSGQLLHLLLIVGADDGRGRDLLKALQEWLLAVGKICRVEVLDQDVGVAVRRVRSLYNCICFLSKSFARFAVSCDSFDHTVHLLSLVGRLLRTLRAFRDDGRDGCTNRFWVLEDLSLTTVYAHLDLSIVLKLVQCGSVLMILLGRLVHP